MRRIFISILAFVFLLTVTSACSRNDKNSTSLIKEQIENQDKKKIPDRKYKIALVMKTLTNPFFVDMEKGAREAETEFGIDLIVKTGAKETSIEQQIQIVEELIVQKVDAIVIAPGSSFELVKVLKKAQDSGIKIVNIDNRLDKNESAKEGLRDVPFISVKNDEGAYLSVKEICDTSKDYKEAVIIEGIREAENAKMRKEGAEKAFKENSNIRIVAQETANWKIDEAYQVAMSLFKKHPNISLVFCANDMMALGLVQYLKESGNKNVLVAGFDNLQDTRKAIAEGWIKVTIDQQADMQGYKGVETAYKLIKGIKVQDETYVPVKVITKDTLTK